MPTPSGELSGQRAVVTGSSSGIGRAIARELAAAGADVLVHGRRSVVEAQAVAAQIEALGRRAVVQLADLRDPDACHKLVNDVWQSLGGCEIWVNNAGCDILTGESARLPFEQKLAELFAVDVRATVLLGRAVAERMRSVTAGGVILNMGWDQAETGMEGDSGQLFGSTKAAVMAFTKSLAATYAPQVRVNCLAPGWIRTAWGERASSVWQERATRESLLGRWGTPEDVARVARFLCGPAAAFITGQILRINGGAVR
jgi:3-oxoacyl-[acyl-carrier protein] reductase